MKKYQKLSYVFAGLAVLLSDIMCASIAFSYCNMLWGIQYAGFSAPAEIAFLLAIPYAVGIAALALLAVFFHRKAGRAL